MTNNRIAIDRDTNRPLTDEEALCAADNPGIYTWVVWVEVPTALAAA